MCYTWSVKWSVSMTVRSHLFPFRTQKLSSLVPKIVRWRRRVKIGSRRLAKPLRRDPRGLFLLITPSALSFYPNKKVPCQESLPGRALCIPETAQPQRTGVRKSLPLSLGCQQTFCKTRMRFASEKFFGPFFQKGTNPPRYPSSPSIHPAISANTSARFVSIKSSWRAPG